MKEYARRQFDLAAPSAGGKATTGAHLRQLQKSEHAPQWIKEQKADSHEPPPEGLVSQWLIFCDLSGRRRGGFSGPEPITDQDVRAWQDNHRTRLELWELSLIFDLDLIYREAARDRSGES